VKKILVSYQIPKQGLSKLFEKYNVYYPKKSFLTKDELINMLPQYNGLLSIFTKKVDGEIINAGEKLEIISNYGVGFDNIDVQSALSKNIVVCNTPKSVAKPTAELCFGLIVDLLRNIARYHFELHTNPNFKWDVMQNLGITLCGKILGILGMGSIGREVAKRALAFDMKIIYHNRNRLPLKIEKTLNAKYVSFNELIKNSDILSVNTPLNSETYHIINKNVFSTMKNSAFFINTARGSVVDEEALVYALKQKQIKGAGIDVFENEPNIHPELLNMNNVVLTPHVGSATAEDRVLMSYEAADNFISFWDKSNPINVVNPIVLTNK